MRTLLLILLIAMLGACTAQESGGEEILVEGFRFQPAALEVPAGTTVTWRNADDIGHTATAGTPQAPNARFDLELGNGAEADHEFTEPGTYAYFCAVHESMRGEIVVTD